MKNGGKIKSIYNFVQCSCVCILRWYKYFKIENMALKSLMRDIVWRGDRSINEEPQDIWSLITKVMSFLK